MSAITKCMILIVLAMFDTIFTLGHVANGAVELNPFMAFFLEIGPWTFAIVKMLFTVTLLIAVLAMCNTESRLRLAKILLNMAIAAYVGVCLYHFYLFLIPGLRGYSSF